MKSRTTIYSFFVAATLLLGFVVAPIYVAAEEEYEDETTTYEEKKQYINEYKTKWTQKKQELIEEAEQKAQEIKEKAKLRAEEAKNQAEQKKLEARQRICENKSEKLGAAINNKAQTARAFYDRFSGFSDKIERFVNLKELNVDNYTELYSSVEDASANADAAIVKLEELKFDVDCSEVNLTTENTQEYRDALVAAREALKTYKTSLVNLLRAVVTSYNSSQGTTDTTTESSDDSQDEGSDSIDESTETNTQNTEESDV